MPLYFIIFFLIGRKIYDIFSFTQSYHVTAEFLYLFFLALSALSALKATTDEQLYSVTIETPTRSYAIFIHLYSVTLQKSEHICDTFLRSSV